jgi:hypothetical protein
MLLASTVAVGMAQSQKGKDKKSSDTKADVAKKSNGLDAAVAELYPEPTDFHKNMVKQGEGVWDATMRAYLAGPDQPPQEFRGVEKIRSVAGGLWLVSEFESDFVGGKKFQGYGITGYDPQKRKIVGSWADNMSASLGTFSGEYDPASKTTTLWFEMPDATTGKPRKDKHVEQYKGEGHKLYTIYMASPNGEQVKLMEIESKRKSDSQDASGEKQDTKAEKQDKKDASPTKK